MKVRRIGALLILMAVLMSGCMPTQEAATGSEKPAVTDSTDKRTSEDRLVQFAAESSSLMLQEPGNQLYAPVAPYLLLSLLGEGAVGETQSDVFKALNQTPASRKSLHSFNEELVGKYLGSGDIKIANSLWLDKPVKLTPGFKQLAEEYYFGDVKQLPFTENPEKSAKAVDKWATKNLGTALYDQSLIEPGFALVLLSTSDMDLTWEHPFDAKLTKEELFHAESGDVKTAMMSQSYQRYPYAAGDDYLATSLPLKNGNRLQLILPNEGVAVRSLVDSKEKMLSLFWIVENQEMKLTFTLPKFNVHNELDLQPNLEKMGLKRAFSEKEAGFSRLSSNVPLFLGRALQKNRLTFAEKQVEMAGYTQVMMPANPEGEKTPEPPAPVVVEEPVLEFKLDRPFIYLISDKDGIPLLQGIVDDPTEVN